MGPQDNPKYVQAHDERRLRKQFSARGPATDSSPLFITVNYDKVLEFAATMDGWEAFSDSSDRERTLHLSGHADRVANALDSRPSGLSLPRGECNQDGRDESCDPVDAAGPSVMPHRSRSCHWLEWFSFTIPKHHREDCIRDLLEHREMQIDAGTATWRLNVALCRELAHIVWRRPTLMGCLESVAGRARDWVSVSGRGE